MTTIWPALRASQYIRSTVVNSSGTDESDEVDEVGGVGGGVGGGVWGGGIGIIFLFVLGCLEGEDLLDMGLGHGPGPGVPELSNPVVGLVSPHSQESSSWQLHGT